MQGGLWGRGVGERRDPDCRVFPGGEVVLAVISISGDGSTAGTTVARGTHRLAYSSSSPPESAART